MDLDIVRLDRDHPGFRDAQYRQRRNAIAAAAQKHVVGMPVADVEYTEGEQRVWQAVSARLEALQGRIAREIHEARRLLPLDATRIPQFEAVNGALAKLGGLRLAPVAGLVSPEAFLASLGRGIFLATQYIRHESRPLYTPEPDVIHELIGHAATLGHPGIAALNRAFGETIERTNGKHAEKLIRAYWYTLEFGLVREEGEIKALGAGLLSSYGELERFPAHAELRPFDLEVIGATPFDPTDYQRTLFVADSYGQLVTGLRTWLAAL